MTTDQFLQPYVHPAAGDECYVVRGRRVGAQVEISLSRERRQKHHLGGETDTLIEVLALKRLPNGEESTYMTYASNLDDAARYAARDELGYYVHTAAEGLGVRVSLVARLLGPDGQVETDVFDEGYFEDPDLQVAVAQANEKASELRAGAEQLNEEWSSRRRAHVLELQNEYAKADAQAEAAQDLQDIVEAESD
jgi:hypothetical protein